MNFRRTTIILLIVTVASTAWLKREWHLRGLKHDLGLLVTAKQALDEHMATSGQELETLRERMAAEQSRNAHALAEVANAQEKLNKADPDNRWAEPPANTPDWNAESPFVWIRKEMMPKFSVPMFAKSGELQPEVAAVFAVDSRTLRSLNGQLDRLMTDYHALETASAKPTDQHLPGPQGKTVTVEVPPLPEDGARFKSQFEAALNEQLGPQRAGLVLQTAQGWIDRQFSGFGSEPKTISLTRLPNGGFNVSIKSGQSWFSCGVPKDYPNLVQEYIPPHLLPLFNEVLTPPAADMDSNQVNLTR